MNEEAKEQRRFVVFSEGKEPQFFEATGPKDAASQAFGQFQFSGENDYVEEPVYVLDASRAVRYTRVFSAERAK